MMRKLYLTVCFLLFAVCFSPARICPLPAAAAEGRDLSAIISGSEEDAVVDLDGEYYISAPVAITKNLTLQRSETAQKAEIRLAEEFTGRHFTVASGVTVKFEGLTFTGHNDTEKNGGGIQADSAHLRIKNCVFSGNAAERGGAIFAQQRFSIETDGCIFENNTASYGGAISAGLKKAKDASPIAIRSTVFTGNSAETDGGALYITTNCVFSAEDCRFEWNSALYGGGASLAGLTRSISLTGCAFFDNAAQANGGGLYMTSCAGSLLTGCAFTKNTAFSGGGAAVNKNTDILQINDTVFKDNAVFQDGGGIFLYGDGSMNVENSLFTGNKAYSTENMELPMHGGGICINGMGEYTVSRTAFVGNEAMHDGGGIYLSANETENDCSFVADSCVFYENIAGATGGGVYFCHFPYTPSAAIIISSTFVLNTMRGTHGDTAGAAVYGGEDSVGLFGNLFCRNLRQDVVLGVESIAKYPRQVMSDNLIENDAAKVFRYTNDNKPVLSEGKELRILPGGLAHNKIPESNYTGWQFKGTAVLPAQKDISGNPRVWGAAMDYGACETLRIPVSFISDGTTVETHDTEEGACAPGAGPLVKAGHSFRGWYISETCGDEDAFSFDTPVTSIVSLYAKWEINRYTVTFHTGGGSAAGPLQVVYAEIPPAVPDPEKNGYKFAGWYYDAGFKQEYDSGAAITDDLNLHAKWEKQGLSGRAAAILTSAAVALSAFAVIAAVFIIKKRRPAAHIPETAGGFSAAAMETSTPVCRDELLAGLSMREREVLKLLFEGRSAKEIASSLSIAFDTARNHVKNIYKKLDVNSRTELFIKYNGKS